MMNSKLISAGAFFLFILASGFWVSRSGKPYGVGILAIHKLIGVALGVYLIRMVYLTHKAEALSATMVIAVVVSVLLFAGMVATGGLISTEKEMPVIVNLVHRILPYLTVVSTGVTIYLLFSSKP
jgi:hypothetical protein